MGALSEAVSETGQMRGSPCTQAQGTSAVALDVVMGTSKNVSYLSAAGGDQNWHW